MVDEARITKITTQSCFAGVRENMATTQDSDRCGGLENAPTRAAVEKINQNTTPTREINAARMTAQKEINPIKCASLNLG